MGISGISGSSYPYQNHLNKINTSQEKTANVKPGYKSSPAECETCKGRKYQDGSNESDVSFKAPGHISPQSSAAAVRAHEQMHVTNAYQKAAVVIIVCYNAV